MENCKRLVNGRIIAVTLLVSFVILTIVFVKNTGSNVSRKINVLTSETADFVEQLDIEQQKMYFESNAQTRRMVIQTLTLGDVMRALLPQIRCPTAARPGLIGDGGKWICNPWRAPEGCTIYSFGVNGDTSFEQRMHEITKQHCKIFSFDLGPQDPKIFEPFQGTFKQWAIVNVTDKQRSQYTVVDIAKEFGHTKIDFMKMDIETWEYVSMEALFKSEEFKSKRLTICQISIELHHYLPSWIQLLRSIEKNGFYMFYKEANYICSYCHEYSYIHESCFEQYGVYDKPYNYNFD